MTTLRPQPAPDRLLPSTQWRGLQRAHQARVDPWIRPRLERRRRGERHPVDDFLFDYYSFRPAQLARWHPGAGVVLQLPAEHLVGIKGFAEHGDGIGVDRLAVGRQAVLLPVVDRLLAATAGRKARFGCSALHEWAMVYRSQPSEIRHSSWPLRLSPADIADVVDRVGLRCTHFDAFRFFTADAAPANANVLTRGTQVDFEQPGCIHATMDLYKWAYQLSPLIGADLIADAFEVARHARSLDMRAAPYDLSSLGVEPLLIETPAGRAQFAELQRELATQGQALRIRLREAIAAAVIWLGDDQRSS